MILRTAAAFVLVAVFLAVPATSQDSATLDKAKKTIKATDLKKHAFKLCNDMKGRKSGQEGEKIVAQYVAANFKKWGLKPAGEKKGSYLQEFKCHVPRYGVSNGTGYNVFGYVEGSDKKLKDEFIVVGAHMDAVGGRGADDNASGTIGVLEIAQAVAGMKKKPKRSILFCTWGSEEVWMVGSYHFVKNTTSIPLKKMKIYLNMDMIGRNDKKERQCWIAGSQSGDPSMKPTVEKHAKKVEGMTIHLEDPKISPPGDVMPFYENGIPFLYFYSYGYGEMHADYHKASDKPEKLDYPSEEKIVRLCFDILLDFANSEKMPKKVDGYRFPHPLRGKK